MEGFCGNARATGRSDPFPQMTGLFLSTRNVRSKNTPAAWWRLTDLLTYSRTMVPTYYSTPLLSSCGRRDLRLNRLQLHRPRPTAPTYDQPQLYPVVSTILLTDLRQIQNPARPHTTAASAQLPTTTLQSTYDQTRA